jgi:glycosyltransferase involved in cell wall biosynthesis
MHHTTHEPVLTTPETAVNNSLGGGTVQHRTLIVVGALGRGGGERQALFAAHALRTSGADVAVFVAQPPLHLIEDGVASDLRTYLPDRRAPWISQLLRLRSSIEHFRPSVIVSFMTSGSARVLLVRCASRTARAACWITSERGNMELRHFLQLPASTALRLSALKTVDAVVVNAASLGANVMSYAGNMGHKLNVIPNVLAPFTVDALSARSGLKQLMGRSLAFPHLVALGSCQRARNYELLISALPRVITRHPGLHLTIIGRTTGRDCGPVADRIRRALKTHSVEQHVTLLGEVKDARMLLPAFDAYVLASKLEGSSNGLAEAVFAHLPIASTPVGDAVELLGGSGVIARGWTPSAMAEAILAVLEAPDLWRTRAAARAATLSSERASSVVSQRWVSVVADARQGP